MFLLQTDNAMDVLRDTESSLHPNPEITNIPAVLQKMKVHFRCEAISICLQSAISDKGHKWQ